MSDRTAANVSAGKKTGAPVPEESQILELLKEKKFREALESAKVRHKRLSSAESERLLAQAYVARMTEMLSQGFLTEAEPLLNLVWQRYPAQRPLFAPLQRRLDLLQSGLGGMLGALAEPAVSEERKQEILDFLRVETTDLKPLAASSALPPDHPLRAGAAAILEALERVTSGPVDAERVDLREIPRRSPLAPWKALVQALASLYAGKAEECRKWVSLMGEDTPPGRLGPVIVSLLDGSALPENSSRAAAALATAVNPSLAPLREKLETLEEMFGKKETKKLAAGVREVMKACQAALPGDCETLKQHIDVRAFIDKAPTVRVLEGFGGRPAAMNSSCWRLLASAVESDGGRGSAVLLIVWGEFFKQALAEGLIRDGSIEEAAFWRHVESLQTAGMRPPPARDAVGFLVDLYEGQQPSIRKNAGLPRPNLDKRLFDGAACLSRICAIDPTSREYDRWVKQIVQSTQKPDLIHLEKVAENWARDFPDDPAPLLCLMEWAEERDALKKAVGYLDRAELLDRLNPKVRGARFRLLARNYFRHLKQNKPDLAAKDLEEINAYPDAQSGDRQTIAAALRVLHEQISKRSDGVEREWERLVGLCRGSQIQARLLVEECVRVSGRAVRLADVPLPMSARRGETLLGAGRVCKALEDAGTPTWLPPASHPDLFMDLRTEGDQMEPAPLQALSKALLRGKWMDALYRASGCGLRKDTAWHATFLYLRACSLPEYTHEVRRANCLTAAAALARRDRNTPLLDDIMETAKGRSNRGGFSRPLEEVTLLEHRDVPMTQVNEVVEYELAKNAFPSKGKYEKQKSFFPVRPMSLFDLPFELFGPPPGDDDEDEDGLEALFDDEDDIEEVRDEFEDVALEYQESLGLTDVQREQLVAVLMNDYLNDTENGFKVFMRSLGFERADGSSNRKQQPARSVKKKKKKAQTPKRRKR